MRSFPQAEPEVRDPSGRSVSVGDRVRVGGAKATVRFVGHLQDEEGVWLGLQWDEVGRGKHDGCARGVRYFHTPEPLSASFVRPQKLEPSCTCAEAIKKYYGEKEEETTAAVYQAGIDELKKKMKVPFIEMVGFDSVQQKQGYLDKLTEACVSDRCIWSSGDLASLCPSLMILDLSKNLFSDWKTIAEIAAQLPLLSNLDLSKNQLRIPSSNEESVALSKYFRNVKTLLLTHCNFEWIHIERISLICQHVEDLILAYNKIESTMPFCNKIYSDCLTTLVLDGNPLKSWNEVLQLGHLKNLKVLSLNDCGIKNIAFNNLYRDEKSELYESLETLYLKQNFISDWRSISELNKLKSLLKLYIVKNPLMSMEDYDTASQHIIARLAKLKELNGSEISREIRRGSEYDYIKKHGLLWQKLQVGTEDAKKEFYLENSNFYKLIQKYGLPDENLLIIKKELWAINSNLLEIYLKDDKSNTIIKKKLPATMTVQKLIALAKRLFSSKSKEANSSINPDLIFIYTNPDDGSEIQVHLENQMKELSYYSIANGNTIIFKWF